MSLCVSVSPYNTHLSFKWTVNGYLAINNMQLTNHINTRTTPTMTEVEENFLYEMSTFGKV